MAYIQEGYNEWASEYDTMLNKTRDTEAKALQELLQTQTYSSVLELGCGTGKNTNFLRQIALQVTAVDFSEAMLDIARQKIKARNVQFIQANFLENCQFLPLNSCGLVVCSLVLEHVENITQLIKRIYPLLRSGGQLYIGELHPFKQYLGSKARFTDQAGNEKTLTTFVHHLSDYLQALPSNKWNVLQIKEYFDEEDTTAVPRVLAILAQKK